MVLFSSELQVAITDDHGGLETYQHFTCCSCVRQAAGHRNSFEASIASNVENYTLDADETENLQR